MVKSVMARYLAKKEMKRIEDKNSLDFMKNVRDSVFNKLKDEGVLKDFRLSGHNVYCTLPGVKKPLKIKLVFIFTQGQPYKEIASKAVYVKVAISLSVKIEELVAYFKKVVAARVRGFLNEDSFENDILPQIRALNRVSHANRLSERADSLQGVDFEIEYYVDKYYSHTTTLLLNVKSSENFLQKNAEKYPGVYNIVYKKGDSVQATLFKIKRLMIMNKTPN